MKRILIICLLSVAGIYAQQTQFFRTYSMGLYDVGETVLPMSDTTYVVAGTTNYTGINGTDMLLFKTNSIGDVVWYKNIGGAGIQSGKSAVMTVDGSGYLVAGYKNDFGPTGYDVWLVKTNLNGDTVWSKSYGGNDWEIAHAMSTLPDSTYTIAGETYSYGNGQRDIYVIRVNNVGDTLWTKTFGGINDDVATFVNIDRNQNILVGGNTESFGAGNSDVYLVYLDLNGDTIWTKTFGTVDDDFGYSAEMYIDTSNQMNFVIGYSSYYAPDLAQNGYIVRIDSIAGNQLAVYPQYEASPYILDHIHLVQRSPGKITFSSNYQESATQNNILYVHSTEYDLSPDLERTFAGGGNENTSQNCIKLTLDGGYIVTGYSENWGPGPTSCFLLKMDTVLSSPDTPTVSLEHLEIGSLEIFPNPVEGDRFYINATDNIEAVSILNMNGQLVHSYAISTGSSSFILEKPMIADGIYLIAIKTRNKLIYKKIIF